MLVRVGLWLIILTSMLIQIFLSFYIYFCKKGTVLVFLTLKFIIHISTAGKRLRRPEKLSTFLEDQALCDVLSPVSLISIVLCRQPLSVMLESNRMII